MPASDPPLSFPVRGVPRGWRDWWNDQDDTPRSGHGVKPQSGGRRCRPSSWASCGRASSAPGSLAHFVRRLTAQRSMTGR